MDTSAIKPRDAIARSYARASAVRTDVAPAQSVNPAQATEPARHAAAPQDAASRDLIDPQSREVFYRARDERERRKSRPPDAALERERAYGHAAAHDDNGPDSQTDLEI